MTENNVFCTYLGHSSFLIEFESANFLFDYTESKLPQIRKDKPLYIFISHTHNDHFNDAVLSAAKIYPLTEIFFGYNHDDAHIDEYIDELPENAQDSISCFDGEQILKSNNGQLIVRSLRSTDEGVAFLLKYEGKTIFHAGDLFLPARLSQYFSKSMSQMFGGLPINIPPITEAQKKEFKQAFIDYTEPLRGCKIDYGMLPLDPRFPDITPDTLKHYMDLAEFKSWSPMHLWGNYEYVDQFFAENSRYVHNAAATTHNDKALKKIEVNKRFVIFGINESIDAGNIPDQSKLRNNSQTTNKTNIKVYGFEVSCTVAIEGISNYSKSVTAKPGDVLDFHLLYKNIGDKNQLSIRFYDELPKGLRYIQGSSFFNSNFNTSGNSVSDALFSENGINLGDYRPNDWGMLTYRVQIVYDEGLFSKGDTLLYNNAKIATADGTGYSKVAITIHR